MEQHTRLAHEVVNAVDAGEGDFEARRLREALVARPGDLDARLQLAARYEELDQPELAIEHYRLAAARFPSEPAPQLGLARALHKKRRTADAAAGLESYLSAYPEAPAEAHAWAGILRDELDHHRAAEDHHRAALERAGGKAAWLHNNLGQNLALQERASDAEREFRLALELEPANSLARNNLATLISDQPAEAAKVLEAGTNDPATAHSNLAAILIEQGRYEEARKELNLALGYNPEHMVALRNLAVVADRDGKPAGLAPGGGKQQANSQTSGAFRRVKQVLARIFVSSETRQPEQPSSATAAGRTAEKAPKPERSKTARLATAE